jgi:hypothetical protein
MSDLHVGMVQQMLLECDLIARPWAPFIGLVELRLSKWVNAGDVFVLDHSSGPLPELGHSVLMHPDSMPTARGTLQSLHRRTLSDAELAAFLYWSAIERRKHSERHAQ